MSTELTPIIGRIEFPRPETKDSKYCDGELLLTSFAGGKENGRMLQLTLSFGHIQFTKDQVKDLIQTLSEWID